MEPQENSADFTNREKWGEKVKKGVDRREKAW